MHDESTLVPLLCLLLDLFGSALLNASTKARCFAYSPIFDTFLALNKISVLSKLHVVPGCHFVEHEFINFDVIQESNKLLPHLSGNNS